MADRIRKQRLHYCTVLLHFFVSTPATFALLLYDFKLFFKICNEEIFKNVAKPLVAGNEVIVKNINANIHVSLSWFLLPFLAFLCVPASALSSIHCKTANEGSLAFAEKET